MTAMASELETLRARVIALEDVCGAAYQLAGTVGAPIRMTMNVPFKLGAVQRPGDDSKLTKGRPWRRARW